MITIKNVLTYDNNYKLGCLKFIGLLLNNGIIEFYLFDRFYAIVYPFKSLRIHTKSRTIRIIILIWTASILLASPYLFCKSYPFSIRSEYGLVSRQICTDRFDEIDVFLFGAEMQDSGRFRLGFFLFLFVVIYVCPSVLILVTCVSIVYTLLTSTDVTRNIECHVKGMGEENKRRVSHKCIV